MLKKVIGAKGIFLLAGVIVMVSLSGCGNDQTEQDSAGTIIYEEEASENQETEHSEQTGTEDKSDSTETEATTKEETPGTAQSETKETTTQNEVASQSQTKKKRFWRRYAMSWLISIPGQQWTKNFGVIFYLTLIPAHHQKMRQQSRYTARTWDLRKQL